jgi:ribosomal protein S18 acetylase RimI-like enzyme
MVNLHHKGAGWTIRNWEPDDSQAIMNLFTDCLKDFPWRGDPLTYQRQLMLDAVRCPVFVAVEPKAGLIGFMIVDLSAGYISHLFVDRNWRLCGIGRDMLALAKRNGRAQLKLDVDVQNKAARAAYEKLGWQVLVDAKPPRGDQQIRMISP